MHITYAYTYTRVQKMHLFLGFWSYVRDSKIFTDLEEKMKGWRESKFQKIFVKIYYVPDIDLGVEDRLRHCFYF